MKFFGSFAFNRKRNVLELEIRQDYTSSGTQKYVVSLTALCHTTLSGPNRLKLYDFFFLLCSLLCLNVSLQGPIKVTVQELDGSFNHMLQIEENSLKHDIPCHSKSRRYRTLCHSPLPGLAYVLQWTLLHYAVMAPENHALHTLRDGLQCIQKVLPVLDATRLAHVSPILLCRTSIRFDGAQPFSNF